MTATLLRHPGHRLALQLLGGALALSAAATLALLLAADVEDQRSGDLVVVLPPGEQAALALVAASDGLVMRGTLLGPVWQVTSPRPGFAGRLRANGALLVLPALPLPRLGLGGCSWLPAASYTRPDIRKLRAGPM